MQGFADLDKIYDWREKVEKVIKRRLQKQREKTVDMEYFSKNPEHMTK